MCPPYKLGSSLAASILHLFHRDLLLPDVTPSLDPSESFLPVQCIAATESRGYEIREKKLKGIKVM
jgi:hypothetical protein